MNNRKLAQVLIVLFVLLLVTEYLKLVSVSLFAVWMLVLILMLIVGIMTIVKLFKNNSSGIAILGIIALALTYIMSHSYPLYFLPLALLGIFVISVGLKFLKKTAVQN